MNEQNPRYDEIDQYEYEFWSIIEKSFGIKLGGMSTSASPYVGEPIEFIARFPTKFIQLKNTPYCFSESKKVIHFTSLPKLYSIVNDCSLRMYNLHNSNDSDEYSYASALLKTIYQQQGLNDEYIESKIENEKAFSFITSCTSLDNLNKEFFWQKYGSNKKGIAIEFEIINNPDDWESFYISKVHYNKLCEFEKLICEWSKLQNKNKQVQYKIEMDQILGLHKSLGWSDEDEIRLISILPDLHYGPFQELVYKDTKPDSPHNSKIQFFKLPLCDKTGNFINKVYNQRIEFFWKLIPKIKISDLHFGPEFETDKDFDKFQIELKSYICDKMNCWLPNLPKRRTDLNNH